VTPILSSLEGMTSMYMASQPSPHTATSIREIIAQLRDTAMFADKVSDADAEDLARLIEEKYGISMGLGAIVDAEDFRPWLHDARINGEIGDFYWGRYRQLLNLKGLPKSVIDATDEVTDRVLDRLGNPRNLSPWSRRGMVVGHVQSGKTANYTGLICKAADAGYRLIVVIAGFNNNRLRNQTQERIDEGFIGRDTGRLAHANKAQRQKIIGVGKFDQREFPVSLTNTLRDFDKATATTNTSQIGQYNVPVVLVIKKNPSTLKHLLEWLKEHSVQQSTQMVQQPMLMIDDEADNASINTAYSREDVTRINGNIRELLSLFHRSCYVGYTATPFANVFIDPDTDDEALKQDLFPRHFIIGLDAPTNYFGAQKVFLDRRDRHVRLIVDNEDVFPMKHKIDHPVDVLPESLILAVRTFIVTRAIRNARGQQAAHASMLVNASRFTDVQGRLRSQITDVVGRIRDAVAVDAGKGRAALKNPEIAALYSVWEQEFADAEAAAEGVDWPAIQLRLHEVLVAARVVEVNASKRSQALDYDQRAEYGVTVIAVGGFSLSRGLTLEGLTVSYFLRNSMMYDTLMQMGRWFGYRPGYEDLCRVWMPADGVGWYSHIHEAMEDLQAQLKRMELAKATPEQFGLAVRSHPETLIVTARNKMGTGKEFPMKVSLAGKLVETTRIRNDYVQLERNRAAGGDLLAALLASGQSPERRPRGHLFLAIPVELIRTFLTAFRADAADPITDPRLIGDYIGARAESELREWDILFASAQKDGVEAEELCGLAMTPFDRGVGEADLKQGILAISGTSRRVGSPGDEREGLTEAQIDGAVAQFRDRLAAAGKPVPSTLPPRIFCEIEGRRPLIIIRFVKPLVTDEALRNSLPGNVLAWSIGFPPSHVEGGTVEYVVNTIRMREMFGEDEIEEEAMGDTE
jgi:hypothetical protein